MRHYDLTTREGCEAFSGLVGPRAMTATRLGMAYSMGTRKLKEQIRDEVLCFARAAVHDDTLPKTAVGALSAACRCGVVFG